VAEAKKYVRGAFLKHEAVREVMKALIE